MMKRLLTAAALLCTTLALTACPSGGEPTGPDVTVANVTVTGATLTVQAGSTIQLSASGRNAAGNSIAGTSFTWSSGNTAIATVSGNGTVQGVAVGTVTITATETGSARTGSATVTVTPPPAPVASITIKAAADTVQQTGTLQLTAITTAASGDTLTGRTVSWTSSNTQLAGVSATGLVTAHEVGGPVTITASAEGKTATFSLTIKPRTVARLAVSSRFANLAVDSTTALQVAALDAMGKSMPAPAITWSSDAESVASVSSTGAVTAIAPGTARILATAGSLVDTAWVAVTGAGDLVSTAFIGGQVRVDLTPGQTITVPVVLDLARAAASGDVGAVQLSLSYDSSVLEFISAASSANATSSHHVPQAGTFNFALAATTAQATPSITLVTVTFKVSTAATIGASGALALNYSAKPMSTTFTEYRTPLVFGGRFTVVAP